MINTSSKDAIHHFGSTLNAHPHIHCVVIEGVFDAAAAGGGDLRCRLRARCPRHRPSAGGGAPTLAAQLRAARPSDAARAMAQWEHGRDFSVDASVRIEAADRASRERRLRYRARPPFALERLRQLDGEHPSYDNAKSGPGGRGRRS
jgi:hypothetical protein